MLVPNYQNLEKAAKIAGYVWFRGLYNLNIIGVRSLSTSSADFDDLLFVAYEDYKGERVDVFACTLTPGEYYLKNLMDSGGAAILCEGQYRGAWKLGWFHGTRALLQIKPVTVYRDKNLDTKVDIVPTSKTTGLYGLFLHEHFQRDETATKIGASSAGCIVPSSRMSMLKIINLCEEQRAKGFGNTFSITIYNESDFTNS